jgi:polar amino acid transport system permease protein
MWDWAAFLHYLASPYMLVGAGVTLGLTAASFAIGMACGVLAALMRRSSRPWLHRPAGFYVWLMRGTPVLIQLIIIYTGLPQIGIRLGVLASSLVGLGLNEGAYLSEIIRAGIEAVPAGQTDAGRALGLKPLQIMRLIVLPQALQIMIPAFGNSFNSLLKTSSLASVISMSELLRRAELLMQIKFKVLEVFAVAAIYYLGMTTAWGFFQSWLERRFSSAAAAAIGSAGMEIGPDAA